MWEPIFQLASVTQRLITHHATPHAPLKNPESALKFLILEFDDVLARTSQLQVQRAKTYWSAREKHFIFITENNFYFFLKHLSGPKS